MVMVTIYNGMICFRPLSTLNSAVDQLLGHDDDDDDDDNDHDDDDDNSNNNNNNSNTNIDNGNYDNM